MPIMRNHFEHENVFSSYEMRKLREDLLREESGTNSVDFFESFVMLKDSDIQPNSF
jgi:hypothetical protein